MQQLSFNDILGSDHEAQPELFAHCPDRSAAGAVWWDANWQLRAFIADGVALMQSRERGQGRWQFEVTGFSGPEGGNGIAHLVTLDARGPRGSRPFPIDSEGRITIMDVKYGRPHWHH